MRLLPRHIIVACAVISAPCFGANSAATFENCPSPPQKLAKAPHVQFSSQESKRFATELRAAAKHPINFAGHFVLATWGCGAGCVMGGAIDARTGKVTMLPFTVSDWPLDVTEPLSFRRDSCLIIVRGSRNEQGHGTYFYKFDGGAFQLQATEAPGK